MAEREKVTYPAAASQCELEAQIITDLLGRGSACRENWIGEEGGGVGAGLGSLGWGTDKGPSAT